MSLQVADVHHLLKEESEITLERIVTVFEVSPIRALELLEELLERNLNDLDAFYLTSGRKGNELVVKIVSEEKSVEEFDEVTSKKLLTLRQKGANLDHTTSWSRDLKTYSQRKRTEKMRTKSFLCEKFTVLSDFRVSNLNNGMSVEETTPSSTSVKVTPTLKNSKDVDIKMSTSPPASVKEKKETDAPSTPNQREVKRIRPNNDRIDANVKLQPKAKVKATKSTPQIPQPSPEVVVTDPPSAIPMSDDSPSPKKTSPEEQDGMMKVIGTEVQDTTKFGRAGGYITTEEQKVKVAVEKTIIRSATKTTSPAKKSGQSNISDFFKKK